MREELRQRLAQEYKYAVAKMKEVEQPAKKLYYFSVFFGEAQRVLNLEWDRDLVLIYTVTQHVHTQVNTIMQNPALGLGLFPVDWDSIIEKLTQVSSNLATYFEETENDNRRQGLYQTLGRLAEIAYAVSGNGSYLYEKGHFEM
jgi:hypothetical protein